MLSAAFYLVSLLLVLPLAALSTETCTGYCPCGVMPPNNASSWCPSGCASASSPFAVDATGVLAVDMARCQPFALMRNLSTSNNDSCPLTAWPGAALSVFRACVDPTVDDVNAPCTPCVIPPPVPFVEQALCLSIDADTFNSVSSGDVHNSFAIVLRVAPSFVFVSTASPGCINATNVTNSTIPVAALQANATNATKAGSAVSSVGVIIVVANPPSSLMQSLLAITWNELLDAGLRSKIPLPPPAPVTYKNSGKLGDALLPLRVAIAVAVGLPLCCFMPAICIYKSGRSAAVTVTAVIVVEGSLGSTDDSRAAATALKDVAHTFFNSFHTPKRVRSITLRTLNKSECALYAESLLDLEEETPETIEDAELVSLIEFPARAMLEMVIVFRGIRWAFNWRREVETPALALQLTAAIEDHGVIFDPSVTIRLLRHGVRHHHQKPAVIAMQAAGDELSHYGSEDDHHAAHHGIDRHHSRITLYSHA